MPFLVHNILIGLEESEEAVLAAAAKRLRVPRDAIRSYAIVQRSLDARRNRPRFCYQIEIGLDEPIPLQRKRLKHLGRNEAVWIESKDPVVPQAGRNPLPERPVIIGFGPAGMFAALRLAEFGYKPLVLERGRDVRRRHRDVLQKFYREGIFDESSNLLFGEGGAGTYSDGKLYTRVRDPLCRVVLETFYQFGADPDILINSRPHIGSDRLPTICMKIRRHIEGLGGEIRFGCRVEDIKIEDGTLTALCLACSEPAATHEWLAVGPVILAVGHSARDTIRMLHGRGVPIVPKPFQIGVRIEHPQTMVDGWQYGSAAGHRRLGPAEYHLIAKGAGGERGNVFSFCMCPGGMILPSNESAGLIATNGASNARRSAPFANSGLVITVDPAALGPLPAGGSQDSSKGASVALRAMAFQEQWERLAFEATGQTYRVPAQRASDFLADRKSDGVLETSYPLGGQWVDLREIVPRFVHTAVKRALSILDAQLPGFAGSEGLVTAPETRASAPFRIVRDPATRESVGASNLYPAGEGAGYAGGIVSAAADGIKTADVIIARYAPLR